MGRGKHKKRRALKKAEQGGGPSGKVMTECPKTVTEVSSTTTVQSQRVSHLGVTDDNFVPSTSQKRGKKKNKSLAFATVKDNGLASSSNLGGCHTTNGGNDSGTSTANVDTKKIVKDKKSNRSTSLQQQNACGQTEHTVKCKANNNITDKKVKQLPGGDVGAPKDNKKGQTKHLPRGNSASNKENKCSNVDGKENKKQKNKKKKQQQQKDPKKQQPLQQPTSDFMTGSDLLACPNNTVLDEATLRNFVEHPAELAELRLVKPAKVAMLFNTGHTEHWAKSPECQSRLIVWDELAGAEYDPTIQCIPGKVQELIQRQRQQQTVHKTDLMRKMKCKTFLKCVECGYKSNVMPLQ